MAPVRVMIVIGLAMGVTAALGQPAIQWRTFQEGAQARIRTFETRVIQTEGDWQMYWRRLTGNAEETAPRGIDWASERLAAIVLGERRTGGFQVYVETIEPARNGGALVRWVELTPGPGEVVTQAMSSPFVIVRIGLTGGPISFATRQMERPNRRPIYLPPGFYDTHHPPFSMRDWYPRPIRYRLIDAGSESGVLTQVNRIINTPEDFRRYLVAILGERRAAQAQMPPIDWTQEYLIAIHMGMRVGQGYSVFVDSVQMINSASLQIRWSEMRPQWPSGPGSTTPYALIAIPRGTGTPTILRAMGRPL